MCMQKLAGGGQVSQDVQAAADADSHVAPNPRKYLGTYLQLN